MNAAAVLLGCDAGDEPGLDRGGHQPARAGRVEAEAVCDDADRGVLLRFGGALLDRVDLAVGAVIGAALMASLAGWLLLAVLERFAGKRAAVIWTIPLLPRGGIARA